MAATHYLHTTVDTSALQKTLTLTTICLGFPVAMVNVLDATTRHTIAVVGRELGSTARQGVLCEQVVGTGHSVAVPDMVWGRGTVPPRRGPVWGAPDRTGGSHHRHPLPV